MRGLFRAASPRALFILGLLTLPAFVFQEKFSFRILETVLFLIMAVLSGKRIRLIPAALLLGSVTAAALLVPYGEVLTHVLGFPITRGALEMGLSRGCLLLGLLYLSKFSVVRGVVFPGRLGRGVGKVFYYFERFSESREKISLKDLPGSLDNLLISVSASEGASPSESPESGPRRLPLLIPAASLALCWALLLLNLPVYLCSATM